MANFRVHRVRFFDYQPKAIQCLSYHNSSQRLALSRSDGSIEIWSVRDNWYQERVIPAGGGESTEAICWCGNRLFSASLNAEVNEYDLAQLKKQGGTEDGCVVLFDISHGVLQYERAFDKQDGRMLTLAWHISGNTIVTGGVDNMRVWSVKVGHAIQRLTVPRQHRNKETIVWSLALLPDMTIVSGDSQGKTSFWNGKHGTLIKSYKSHKSDVLVVTANASGNTVASGGIDPQVVQFRLAQKGEGMSSEGLSKEDGAKEWVPSRSHGYHTHDVRAMAFVGSYLISAGVDTTMIGCRVGKKLVQEYLKLPGIPHTPIVQVARTSQMILFNYGLYLELWKFGSSNQSSAVNGEILPLNSQPMKLLRLAARSETCVVCSALSHDAQLLAYSDQSSIRVYRVEIDHESDPPTVSLNKLKFIDPPRPSHRLAFTDDNRRLVLLSENGGLVLMDVTADVGQVLDTVSHTEDSVPHQLAVSRVINGSFSIAYTDHLRNTVHIYKVVNESKLEILEYSVQKLTFTQWCKPTLTSYHPDWLARTTIISHVTYCHGDEKILVQDAESFCLLNKREKFPNPLVKGSLHAHKSTVDLKDNSHKSTNNSQTVSSDEVMDTSQDLKHGQEKADSDKNTDDSHNENAFHICDKYKYLLMADILDDDWMVIVERQPIAINQALPPALQLKKFGT